MSYLEGDGRWTVDLMQTRTDERDHQGRMEGRMEARDRSSAALQLADVTIPRTRRTQNATQAM